MTLQDYCEQYPGGKAEAIKHLARDTGLHGVTIQRAVHCNGACLRLASAKRIELATRRWVTVGEMADAIYMDDIEDKLQGRL